MKVSYIIIVFLLLALIFSLTLVVKTTILSGKAAGSPTTIALENSYLFASPLQAKADNREFVRITVFLLDGRGLGVAGKEVELSAPKPLKITTIQTLTDDSGKAIFDIASSAIGKYEISAHSEGKSLPQKVKIGFY